VADPEQEGKALRVLRELWENLEMRAQRAADTHERLRHHDGASERRHAADALVELHLLANISFSQGPQVLKALAATRPPT